MYYVSLTGIEAVKGIKGTPLRSLAFLMMGHTKIEPAPGFGLI